MNETDNTVWLYMIWIVSYCMIHSLLTIWFDVIEDFEKDAITKYCKVLYGII